MNLVMHQLLSFAQKDLQIGNHLGESVKGKKYLNYSEGIQKGILLHRFIDSFSDAHPQVKNSSAILHKNHRKFSPIIIDVYYDFLLIKNWSKFSDTDFQDFKTNVYQTLKSAEHLYPPSLLRFTNALIQYDWFEMYRTYEGIETTLTNMGKRTKFPNNMHQAKPDLFLNEAKFEADFLIFMPDILKACKEFLQIN